MNQIPFPIKPLATLLVPFIFFTSNTTKHSNSISHDRVNYFTNYHLIPIRFLFMHVTFFGKHVHIQFIIYVKTSTRFSETSIVLLQYYLNKKIISDNLSQIEYLHSPLSKYRFPLQNKIISRRS